MYVCYFYFFNGIKSLNVIDSQLSVFKTSFTLNISPNINIASVISKSVKVYFISEG